MLLCYFHLGLWIYIHSKIQPRFSTSYMGWNDQAICVSTRSCMASRLPTSPWSHLACLEGQPQRQQRSEMFCTGQPPRLPSHISWDGRNTKWSSGCSLTYPNSQAAHGLTQAVPVHFVLGTGPEIGSCDEVFWDHFVSPAEWSEIQNIFHDLPLRWEIAGSWQPIFDAAPGAGPEAPFFRRSAA
jgi:hypothetical protein